MQNNGLIKTHIPHELIQQIIHMFKAIINYFYSNVKIQKYLF